HGRLNRRGIQRASPEPLTLMPWGLFNFPDASLFSYMRLFACLAAYVTFLTRVFCIGRRNAPGNG
ncbi:MAG: hypothetical protein WCF85_15250, partial [Rhodospirillaceae bacterium]